MAKTRCEKCGSTSRDPYYGVITRDIAGKTADGGDFTQVVWRRTRCKKCGQHRTDKSFEKP